MRTPLLLAAIVTGLLGAAAAGAEEELTVDQIIAKANFVAYYQGGDGRARVKMEIVDAQQRKRERDMTILRWDAPEPVKAEPTDVDKEAADPKEVPKNKQQCTGEQKFYVFFHEPADVSQMALLVWKHLDRDDDRWLYLPKIDLLKRIAGSEKRTSFVGGDFFYEDISGRNPAYDTHKLVETSKSFYVLDSTPTDPKSVEFGHYKTWIHRTTFLVIKTEYYDREDRPYRRYEAKSVKQIQGYWTVTKSRMTDLRTNRYTEITYSSVGYDAGIPESIFTERYLRRAPTEYLKVPEVPEIPETETKPQ